MVERARPKDILPVLNDGVRPVAAWQGQAEQLMAKGLVGSALLAEVRAAGVSEAGSTPERLVTWLKEKTAPRSEKATEEAQAAIEKMQRFGDAELEKEVARAIDGIVDGGDPVELFRTVAELLREDGKLVAALDVVRGASALGSSATALVTTSDVLLDLGRFDEAREVESRLSSLDPAIGKVLRTTLDALAHPFDFRAAEYLAGDPDDDTELSPRSLEEAHAAIRSMARRVHLVRNALVRQLGDAPWLPTVAPLLAHAGPSLRDDYGAEDLPDTIPELVFELRNEWARLSWALAALGATKIEWPTAIARPRCSMDFVDDFTAARHDLLCDIAEGQTPNAEDDLDKALLGATWGGTPLAELAPPLAQLWLDETEASLAGLRWAMGRADDPWSVE